MDDNPAASYNHQLKIENKTWLNTAQLVEQMLTLNKQLAAAKAPQTQTILQRRIDATDKQIDE